MTTKCVTNLPLCPDPLTRFIRQEIPGGLLNGVNTTYTTAYYFESGSLEVYLDGKLLDSGLDFTENLLLNGFDIITDSNNPQRLNTPFRQSESLRVNYVYSDQNNKPCILVL